MGKILFIDVDGTLVDYENHLPASAVEAIRLARRAGHRAYICTGRSEAEVYKNIWDIGLDGMIGGNGSYVKDRDTAILHQHLSKEQCKRIVDYLHQKSLPFYLESNSGLYGSEDFETEALPAILAYAGRKGKATEGLTCRDFFPDLITGADLIRDDVNKISFALHSYQDYLDAKEAFPDLLAGTWGGVGETALFGDLGVKGITKASAIDALLSYLGADLADTIAFGDAKVDIPMLEHCAYGVAMGNGGEEIRSMADYVTDDVQCDGLYKAFAHLGLLG